MMTALDPKAVLENAARRTPAPLAHRVRGLSDRALAWLFITPTIALLLAINIFPLLWTIRLSFTNYRANRPNAAVFTGIPPSSFEMIGSVKLAPWSIIIVDTWMWTPYVMLICLAGLRSIPEYIYEAAEVDRASKWRQFWSITLPMALPFIMLAV